MECIDFDAYFSDYLNDWVEKNKKKYKRPEEMEDEVPNVYLRFLNTPATWLDGETPGAYFGKFDDAQMLCDWLVAYTRSEASVPNELLDRLEELGESAQGPLMALCENKQAPCEARMHAIELLRQLDSHAPMVTYLRWQVERDDEEEILENALESLHEMGESVIGPARTAFAAAEQEGKEALLDILANYPADDDTFFFALNSFQKIKEKRALYASYLGKMNDDRALEALLDVAEGNDVSYIDFIEIRNAVERLGGEAPIRDFTDDPTYQAVKKLQK